jgi:hypothetical protein
MNTWGTAHKIADESTSTSTSTERTQAVKKAVVEEAVPEQAVLVYWKAVMAESEQEICALPEPIATQVLACLSTPK